MLVDIDHKQVITSHTLPAGDIAATRPRFTLVTHGNMHTAKKCLLGFKTRSPHNRVLPSDLRVPILRWGEYTFILQTIITWCCQSQFEDCERICWFGTVVKVSSHDCWSQSTSLFTIMTSYHEHSVAWCNQTQLWTRYHTNRECL
jgi:hypothetical protein